MSERGATPEERDLTEAAKRAAGEAALAEVRSGMTLGLGTGSTIRYFIEALGEALGEGGLTGIRGVPTSEDTRQKAHALGIPLVPLHEAGVLDLAVDGADEVTPTLDLIKGLGGAHLREKMVVQAARRFVVVADTGKQVERLGARSPLPVEVVPFGWEAHLPFFRSLGADPVLRRGPGGDAPFVTDNGNLVVDLHLASPLPGRRAAERLDEALRARAGVVETGFFLGVTARGYLANPDTGQVERLDAETAGAPAGGFASSGAASRFADGGTFPPV